MARIFGQLSIGCLAMFSLVAPGPNRGQGDQVNGKHKTTNTCVSVCLRTNGRGPYSYYPAVAACVLVKVAVDGCDTVTFCLSGVRAHRSLILNESCFWQVRTRTLWIAFGIALGILTLLEERVKHDDNTTTKTGTSNNGNAM